ncbi:ankyrin repeat domain-containing protein [Nocardia sp. NPDC127579]|uniref:ankyrin repeat domain-containing protein n=1 Tax=Nocardia sp. NPDC127579 TaxID=3345402 RepID=UPI003625D026
MSAVVGNPFTPAHQAVELEDVQTLARLLADGVDPDEVHGDMTLLTHAIDIEGDSAWQTGDPMTVHTTAVLLGFGADPRLADPAGRTPTDLAGYYGHHLAIRLLQRHITSGVRLAEALECAEHSQPGAGEHRNAEVAE